MNKPTLAAAFAAGILSMTSIAVAQSGPVVVAQAVDAPIDSLPLNTLIMVTPAAEITSKKMKEGTKREFLVFEDVVHDGMIIIPRGSKVEATVTWRTGKGIVGKSAKFELSFDWVRVGSHNWKIRGSHRQEGRGNTAGALLGATFITGRSAVMVPGQVVNAFTDEAIPFRSNAAQTTPTIETTEATLPDVTPVPTQPEPAIPAEAESEVETGTSEE